MCVVIPQLQEISEGAPPRKASTLAANSHGERWTIEGFTLGSQLLRGRSEGEGLVAPGLTFHGLRHTFAPLMREEGFGTREIADAFGQASEQMARHYSRDADRESKMRAVGDRIADAELRRGKL